MIKFLLGTVLFLTIVYLAVPLVFIGLGVLNG